MIGKHLVLYGLCACLVTAGCSKKATNESNQEDATTSQQQASPESDADDNATQESVDRVDFSSRTVTVPDDVEVLTEWRSADAWQGTWTDCTLQEPIARLGKADRSPIRQIFVHDEHLYVVTEFGKNETEIQAFTYHADADTCLLAPWPEFGQNSVLALGQGIADVGVVGDTLVAIGVQTHLFDLKGEPLGGCDDLRGLTRVRGRTDGSGVVRKNGHGLYDLEIRDGSCILEAQPPVEGEELVGMDLGPVGAAGVFAVMQHERVPNALAYLEDGKMRWRYFPGDERYEERITGISSLAIAGSHALLVRSVAKTLDLINAKGERLLHMALKKDPSVDTLVFPRLAAAIDAHRILVTFVEQKSASEVSSIRVRLLTLAP